MPSSKPNPTIFDSIYSSLNPEQRRAVDLIEGPVMVMAGPGTGKTQVLAARIANILKQTDSAPHNILALTFTDSAANTMRQRLVDMIGQDGYYAHISTFHAFCSEVIQSNPEYFPFSRDAQPLTDLERFSIMENILSENNFEVLKPLNTPFFYVRDCIDAIQNLKRENVFPDDLRKLLADEKNALEEEKKEKISKTELKRREKNLAKQQELLEVFVLYQKELKTRGRYDFEDMIGQTVQAFQDDELLLRQYQEKFQYFLVDEYQDTNNAQNTVVKLLASFWGDQANVFVVGDVSQSLYRFQGASIENTLAFLQDYPQAQIVTLTKNYRSPQEILDAATAVIHNNTFTHEHVLQTLQKKDDADLVAEGSTQSLKKTIHYAQLSSPTLENAFLAEQISSLITTQHVKPKDVVILIRKNADALPISEALSRWGVASSMESGGNVLDHPLIIQLLQLLKVIQDIRRGKEDIEVFTVANYPWIGLNHIDILKLSRHASEKKKSLFEAMLDPDLEGLENPEAIQQFQLKLVKWATEESSVSFPEWFEKLLEDSGYLHWILEQPTAVGHLHALNACFDSIKDLARKDPSTTLETFLEMLRVMEEHHLSIVLEPMEVLQNAVRISTVHKAKGMEWDYVFVTQAIDTVWGNVQHKNNLPLPEGLLKYENIDKKEKNEDERRLFYVALTRAKKQITITSSKTKISSGTTKFTVPSMFVNEIPAKLLQYTNIESFEKKGSEILHKMFAGSTHVPVSQPDEKALLKSLLERFTLSPTALNTYLECAYKFKLNTLIRVPRAKRENLSFGTAIHKALEVFFSQYLKTDKLPDLQTMFFAYEKALEKEGMSKAQFERWLNHGKKALAAYYDVHKEEFKKPVFIERFFGYKGSQIMIDDIPISGKFDKIDWIDPTKKTIQVVDYKTGQPKSRNEIEGISGTKNGNYKRQLIFYKLLADLDKTFELKVESGALDFVEADKQTGKHRREEFLLTKEDADELRVVIKDVMQHIRSLSFDRTTNFSICTNCEYKFHCWPNGVPQQEPEQLALLENPPHPTKKKAQRQLVKKK